MEKENTGLQLLKKGQKGVMNIVFSRLGLIVIMLLVQIAILMTGFIWFREALPHIMGGSAIFSIVMVIYLINSRINPTAQTTWLIISMMLPVFGALLFWYTQSDLGHRMLKKRLNSIMNETKDMISQSSDTLSLLDAESPESASLAHYIMRSGCYPVFDNTKVKYFPSGETKFEELLHQLRKAEKFIFLEYFIIDEGIMWGRVLEILARKAKTGVDVRVMYDGTCEFSTLPHDYPKLLQEFGIKCKMFSPATPFMSTHYNYRDHRKIVVIDGHTAFTGGINLADEYINRVQKYGHWKDTAVMLKGEAVNSFTLMFLQMWNIDERVPEYEKYLRPDAEQYFTAPGYVLPFSDSPLDNDKVGERVYMDILNRSQKYVHIMSPYLIVDNEMETALKFAAERGVDVKLILPAIPDKKIPYALAKTHYKSLLESGVKIYEYTPGFVHAKVFVSDDCKAVVGTINLDYRSFYHHFECAVYMYKTSCIDEIELDFQQTLSKCMEVTSETIKNEKRTIKIGGIIFKLIAPLM